MIKRLFDIVVSLTALVFLFVPMLLIVIAIRLESRGSAIFRQRRAGWKSKPFVMWKFRTMRSDVDPYGGSPHSQDDPRMTRIGRFLRETSLDEFPQLFNVIFGTMSLVGPRPLYERQAQLWTTDQKRRLDVRPGITGYAQAYGRGTITIEKKIEMDLYYIENASLWMDLKIICRTILNVFARGGEIYETQYSDEKKFEDDGNQ